jgi:preprotein translocase subunit YajC
MFGLIAVLIFFMFSNGKKRQQAMQELQNGLRPGADDQTDGQAPKA